MIRIILLVILALIIFLTLCDVINIFISFFRSLKNDEEMRNDVTKYLSNSNDAIDKVFRMIEVFLIYVKGYFHGCNIKAKEILYKMEEKRIKKLIEKGKVIDITHLDEDDSRRK